MKAWWAATVLPLVPVRKHLCGLRDRCIAAMLATQWSPVRESHPAHRFCRPLRSLARSQEKSKLLWHPGIALGTPVWKVLPDGHQRVSLNTYAAKRACAWTCRNWGDQPDSHRHKRLHG